LKEFQELYGTEYKLLSQEKREEYMDKLRAAREERALQEASIIRKLGIHATADIRTVTKNLVESTATLHERAGYAVIAFGAKTDYGGSATPMDLIPPIARNFCETVLGMPPELIAMKLETFFLKGGAAAVEVKESKSEELRTQVVEMLRHSFGTFSLFF
jgi:hypothetical protein